MTASIDCLTASVECLIAVVQQTWERGRLIDSHRVESIAGGAGRIDTTVAGVADSRVTAIVRDAEHQFRSEEHDMGEHVGPPENCRGPAGEGRENQSDEGVVRRKGEGSGDVHNNEEIGDGRLE